MSTRPHRREQTRIELARLGRAAADAVARAVRTPGIGAGRQGTVGRVAARATVPVPPRDDPVPSGSGSEPEPQLAVPATDEVARRTAYTRVQGVRLAHLARAVRRPRCTVAALSIGDLQLVGIGAEPFLALDQGLRDSVGQAAVLVGYTDGYLGYLPTDAARSRPEYEVQVSPCGHGAADAVLDRCVRLLQRKDELR